MPQSRERSPGSFRDELGGVIDRVAPKEKTAPTEPHKPNEQHKQGATDAAELNDRLFEQAWKKA